MLRIGSNGPMSRSFSTAKLAKMWDVSESTVKRWADAGLLKCRKTVGGHRKFDLDAVLEFQARSGLVSKGIATHKQEPSADGELDRLLAMPDFVELSLRYREAAIAGQSQLTSTILTRAYLSGMSLATISEEIIRPAMWEIGEMWRAGKVKVFEEHLATFSTMQALSELHSIANKKAANGRRAIVGCADGELHQIASAIIRYILEEEGWTVIFLGPYTPLFSFADAVMKFKPDLVAISATMSADLERSARDYESLHRVAQRHRTKIVIGGLAVEDAETRARFRGATCARTLHDLVNCLRRLEDELEKGDE
ncbi:MAG TPA: cobalamin-dependent protein [Blastocatellia bacterium]|nr:cobalamin-dependent protein [Blastocatellia bacterium]